VPDISVGSIHWRGADIGNVRVGGPGVNNLVHVTAEWFHPAQRRAGLPLVPVINSQNKGGVIAGRADVAGRRHAERVTVMAQLAKQ
jgi:hypothetical protein